MQYKQKQIKLLGYIVDGNILKPIPEKKTKVLDFKSPKTKKELQRFLGFVNYYRKYIPNLAEMASCLYNALRDKNEALIWT